jgi:hypothetical protein
MPPAQLMPLMQNSDVLRENKAPLDTRHEAKTNRDGNMRQSMPKSAKHAGHPALAGKCRELVIVRWQNRPGASIEDIQRRHRLYLRFCVRFM